MAIIKKRIDKLTFGDILPANAAYGDRVVLAVKPSIVEGALALCWYSKQSDAIDEITAAPNHQVDVDVPRETTLTPAQQHADELLDLLVQAHAWARGVSGAVPAWTLATRLLLDDIRPKPPTLAETAAAAGVMADYLHLIANDPSAWRVLDDAARKRIDEARAVITRAREASK